MTSHESPSVTNGLLLLADISGYTSFLQDVHVAHRDDAFAGGAVPDAYAMMSGLLDGIVGRLVPPFVLSKLEGDAVFVYAVDPSTVPRGADALGCLRDCYADFRQRLGAARSRWQCWCEACSRVEVLDLKFILHAGPFVIQEIASRPELVGPQVVMAHRLLKSSAEQAVGRSGYALVTEVAAIASGIPTKGAVEIAERYDHYPPIRASVFVLRDD